MARRRSILVLPLTGAGGDTAQTDLADAITDELIASFGSLPGVFVIGRGTAFTFRGRTPDIRQLGRDLDVRYVLDGTVRRSDAQILVSLHLQDTSTGGHSGPTGSSCRWSTSAACPGWCFRASGARWATS